MDKIYVFGIRTKNRWGDIQGVAVDGLVIDDRDGKKKPRSIANHLSSTESWFKHDMGITSDWKHDIYKEKHPDGYELEFIGVFDEVKEAIDKLDGKLELIE